MLSYLDWLCWCWAVIGCDWWAIIGFKELRQDVEVLSPFGMPKHELRVFRTSVFNCALIDTSVPVTDMFSLTTACYHIPCAKEWWWFWNDYPSSLSVLFLQREQLWTGCTNTGELCVWHLSDLKRPFQRIQLPDCRGVSCMIKVKNQVRNVTSGPKPPVLVRRAVTLVLSVFLLNALRRC